MTAPTFELGPCEGLSSFQREHLQAIRQDPMFSVFVLVDGSYEQTFFRATPGPLDVLWYDDAGNLWVDRIGVNKLLHRISSKEEQNR